MMPSVEGLREKRTEEGTPYVVGLGAGERSDCSGPFVQGLRENQTEEGMWWEFTWNGGLLKAGDRRDGSEQALEAEP